MPYAEPTKQLVVEIFVRDAARSRAFYEGLGFEAREDRGAFVILAWDDCELFLDERPNLTPPASPVANIRVMTPNVDAMWARAQAMGARVVTPIEDRSYGLRDFTIADPDGFGVRFGAWLSADHQD
jgi:catechol 2,3-dioxygenase-like lactoylglutathione lyase family enzyme